MKARILIVDDHQELARALGRLLRASGYDVEVHIEGRDALEALSRTPPPDLVLTDLYMPEVSGVDVARAAQATRPRPAVLIMTGTPESALVADATQVLGHPPLQKPLDGQELVARIEAALAGRQDA